MAYRTGKFSDAVHAFHICIVLSPETAECYYNRGLAYQELGDISKAVRDYGQALKLNPRLTDAALNRGILFYRMERLDDATSDLEQALHSTSNPAAQGDILHTQALIELARGNRKKALDHLKTASDCGHAKARELRQRLLRER